MVLPSQLPKAYSVLAGAVTATGLLPKAEYLSLRRTILWNARFSAVLPMISILTESQSLKTVWMYFLKALSECLLRKDGKSMRLWNWSAGHIVSEISKRKLFWKCFVTSAAKMPLKAFILKFGMMRKKTSSAEDQVPG